MKPYDKWLRTLSLYAGGKNAACPVCGSKNLEIGYVVIDSEKQQGYGALWCNDCMHGFCLSRVVFDENSDNSKIIPALPKGLIFA